MPLTDPSLVDPIEIIPVKLGAKDTAEPIIGVKLLLLLSALYISA